MSQTDQLEEAMKKVMMVGVGAVAITAEKSKKLLNELAEKGAATVEEGKARSEELKHSRDQKDVDDYLDSLTPEQMEELKKKILQREAAETENSEAEEAAPEEQENQPETNGSIS